MAARDALISAQKESCVAVTHGVLILLTGDCHGAIEAGAAVHTLEVRVTQVALVLVLPAATHGVLVSSARRNLHLEHFFPTCLATETLSDVVLRSRKGAFVTVIADCVLPWAWTVTHQVGSFVALGTTYGTILRMGILSLGTQTIPLLPVTKRRDQSGDP